jgi:hypothetical protein
MSDDHSIGSGPVDPRYVEAMKTVGRAIDMMFNPDGPKNRTVGWIVITFAFGNAKEGELVNYMSNADRADVVTMLKEQLRYFEGWSDKHKGNA